MENTFTIPRFGDDRLTLRVGHYQHGGNTAVQLVSADGEETYATLSVNVPDEAIPSGLFAFKTYSENEGLLPELLAQSRVEVIGVLFGVGPDGSLPVCRLVGPEGR